MIWIYRPHSSTSARLLAETLDGVRSKNEARIRARVRPNDKIVLWGAHLPNIQGRTINNVPLRNKFEDAVRLQEAGISTVRVARTRPLLPAPPPGPLPTDPLIVIWEDAAEAAEAFSNLTPTRNDVARGGVNELISKLTAVTRQMTIPAPVAPPSLPGGPDPNWLARRFNHVGGDDLLRPTTSVDYYSKREQFANEYRVHSFLGRSIRAGKKVHRTPQSETPFHGTPHQWIRSFDAGWQISYADDSGIRQKHRDIAHAAVRALGLQFGAVDIGEKGDGTLIVLEVNRAPGVEGGSTESYGRAMRRWAAGEWTAENVETSREAR